MTKEKSTSLTGMSDQFDFDFSYNNQEESPTPEWTGYARNSDPVTSKLAVTKDDKIRWGSQKAELLLAYKNNGELTDEEAGKITGLYQKMACYRKRCGELRFLGLIEETGETRLSDFGKSNLISRITEKGKLAVDEMAISI